MLIKIGYTSTDNSRCIVNLSGVQSYTNKNRVATRFKLLSHLQNRTDADSSENSQHVIKTPSNFEAAFVSPVNRSLNHFKQVPWQYTTVQFMSRVELQWCEFGVNLSWRWQLDDIFYAVRPTKTVQSNATPYSVKSTNRISNLTAVNLEFVAIRLDWIRR